MTLSNARQRLRNVGDLLAFIRTDKRRLRDLPIAAVTTDQASAGDAVRWLGVIDVAGRPREALFCHPVSSITYRCDAMPGDRIAAVAALLPDAWDRNTGGVEFTLTVVADGTSATTSRTLTVNPHRRARDRRGRTISVPADLQQDGAIAVTLRTRVPDGASGAFAWGFWGDPAICRPRPLADVLATLRHARRRASAAGFRTAVRELRGRARLDGRTAAYRRWAAARIPGQPALEAMSAAAARLPYRPLISIITPVYNTDPRWLRACIASVQAQVYDNWELCLCDDGSPSAATRDVLREQTDPRIHVRFLEQNSRISAASNAALALARGEFVALLDHDDELTPDALLEMVRHLNAVPDADVIYSDEDKRDEDGELSEPFFKPCWSPEHLLSAMYTCHLTVARRSLVERLGGFRVGYEGAQDHDLMLRLSEATPRIEHVPRVLYHWRRTPESTASAGSAKPWADDAGKRALEDYLRRHAIAGEVVSGGVPGLYRVKFAITGDPLVTIIVVARSDGAGLAADAAAAAALREGTGYPRVDIVTVTGTAASLPRDVNGAVRASSGAHVVLIDAAVRPLDAGWLAALLEYSQQDPIGAASGKILYPDGRLRHIGIATCVEGGPANVFDGHPGDSYGYFSSAIGVRNYAALSGECLMTRREVFDRVGGLDERLSWDAADVDYCTRVRAAGCRLVFTPYARLQWTGGAASVRRPAAAGDDPYYNANLSRRSADYRLDA